MSVKSSAKLGGFEIDVGGEALQGDAAPASATADTTRTLATVAGHLAAHAFIHDYAKLSVAYTLSRSWGDLAPARGVGNEVVARLHLAF